MGTVCKGQSCRKRDFERCDAYFWKDACWLRVRLCRGERILRPVGEPDSRMAFVNGNGEGWMR